MSSALVEKLYCEGARAWPALKLRPADFAVEVARCSRACQTPLTRYLADVQDPAGLYLSIACLQGCPGAWPTLEQHVLSRIHLSMDADVLEEAKQRTRCKLFGLGQGPGAQPGLVKYAGGNLRAFVHLIVRREAYDILRVRRRDTLMLTAIPFLEEQPEWAALRKRHEGDFRQAVARAWCGLGPYEQQLLRLHLEEKLTVNEVATRLDKNPMNVRRHLPTARANLEARLHAELNGLKPGFSSSGRFHSTLQWMRSQIGLALSRLARGQSADPPDER